GWPKTGGSSPMRAGTVVWDIDGDGPPEILAGSDDGKVWAWHANGTLVAGFPVVVTTNLGRMLPLAVSHEQPAVIAAGADDGTLLLLNADGTLLGGPFGYAAAPSAPIIGTVANGPAAIFAEGTNLHALGLNGIEGAPFPVTLASALPSRAEISVGDIDQDGSD